MGGSLLAQGGGRDHQVDAHAKQHDDQARPRQQALGAKLVGVACAHEASGGGHTRVGVGPCGSAQCPAAPRCMMTQLLVPLPRGARWRRPHRTQTRCRGCRWGCSRPRWRRTCWQSGTHRSPAWAGKGSNGTRVEPMCAVDGACAARLACSRPLAASRPRPDSARSPARCVAPTQGTAGRGQRTCAVLQPAACDFPPKRGTTTRRAPQRHAAAPSAAHGRPPLRSLPQRGAHTLPLRPWGSTQSLDSIVLDLPIRFSLTVSFWMELRPCLLMSIFLPLLATTVVLTLLRALRHGRGAGAQASADGRRRRRPGRAAIARAADGRGCSRPPPPAEPPGTRQDAAAAALWLGRAMCWPPR